MRDAGLSHLDTRIRDAIEGHTQSDPIDLADIIFAVDSYERIVLGDNDLIGGLQRLMEAGQIAEVPGPRFYKANDLESRSITSKDIEAAVREYHRRFSAAVRRLDRSNRARKSSEAHPKFDE